MNSSYPELVFLGHCCLDMICTIRFYPPEDGESHIIDIDESHGGGAAATAAAASAKAGASAAMIAQTGDDAAGELIREELRQFGVDIRGMTRVKAGSSLRSIVMVNAENGMRTKFPCEDLLPDLAFDETQTALISRAKVLHLDGTRYENAKRAAAIARDHGAAVSLDACVPFPDPEKNRELVSLADILITDSEYPGRVTGEQSLDDALRILAGWGSHQVLITTCGADGCRAFINGRICRFPAYHISPVVDTTGCGDVFHGAFLAEWIRENEIERCIRFASAAAALKTRKTGGRAGIPEREEILEFLSGQV